MIIANTVIVREATGCPTPGNIDNDVNVVKGKSCYLGESSSSSINRSSDMKYYTETLAKIHEAKLVPKNVLELKLGSSGKIQVICKACSKGKKERLIEQEAKKTSEESKETSELRFKEAEKRFPGGFELLRVGALNGKCRCKSCNQLITLMPERGCYISNVEAHKKSCGTTTKRKQSSIESFVLPSKKPKTQ